MIVVGCVAIVCVTLLVGLVFVLQHLAAMRATTGEIAEWDAAVAAGLDASRTAIDNVRIRFEATDKRLDDLDKRLVHLNNRTQR